MIITVRDRQNIFDIAIQYFGDLNFVSIIINDNGLPWSAQLQQGQQLIINNQNVGNEEIKGNFTLSNTIVINGRFTNPSVEKPTFDNTIVRWDNTNITFDRK